MDVSEAVDRRRSVRAFRPDPVPAGVVRDLIAKAHRSPSGGNLQPWKVHAIAGEELERFRAIIREKSKATPMGEGPEYDVYPSDLWEPLKARRFAVGEGMYAALGIPREDRAQRLQWFARNYDFFGAPVALFFTLHRRCGPPQWSDVGMYIQTLMLLAVEAGLDTCPQEAWTMWHKVVGEFLGLDADHMLFCGMALGFRDAEAPVNGFRAERDPFDAFAEMRGF